MKHAYLVLERPSERSPEGATYKLHYVKLVCNAPTLYIQSLTLPLVELAMTLRVVALLLVPAEPRVR